MGSNGNGQVKKKNEKKEVLRVEKKEVLRVEKKWKRLEVKRRVVAELYH